MGKKRGSKKKKKEQRMAAASVTKKEAAVAKAEDSVEKKEASYTSKKDVIRAVAAEAEESAASVGKILNAVLNVISESLSIGSPVRFTGFGSFKTTVRAERAGRNPHTGEAMTYPEKTVAKFVPGSALRSAVNDK